MQPDENGYFYVGNQRCVGDFFSYDIDFNTAGSNNIAAGTTVTGNFVVQAGQYFLWQQSLYMADITNAAQLDGTRVIPLCSVLITDTNSGKNLNNNAAPVPSLFGTGQLPFIMPQPRLCQPQSIIQAAVTNYSAATAYNLRLTFAGLALIPA